MQVKGLAEMTNQSSALREPEREQDHLRPPPSSPQNVMPGIFKFGQIYRKKRLDIAINFIWFLNQMVRHRLQIQMQSVWKPIDAVHHQRGTIINNSNNWHQAEKRLMNFMIKRVTKEAVNIIYQQVCLIEAIRRQHMRHILISRSTIICRNRRLPYRNANRYLLFLI